jgi:hypothetical protein
MLGDGRRETSTKLFFIEVKAYRSPQATREPEPILIAVMVSEIWHLPPRRRLSCLSCGTGSLTADRLSLWVSWLKRRSLLT